MRTGNLTAGGIFDVTKKGIIYPIRLRINLFNDFLLDHRYNIVLFFLGCPVRRSIGAVDDYNSINIGGLGNVAAAKWGAFAVRMDMVQDSDPEGVAAADNETGYNTEALALAALDDAGDDPYILLAKYSILASEGDVWISGTDAFPGGETGNPAQQFNVYYELSISGE
jgi:hypothetical protein